jgi:hypothetical protein
MSINTSPNSVTNGLVFYYNQNSIQSYQGPPITNLISYNAPINTSGTGYNMISGSETTFVPGLGTMRVQTCQIQNNYPSVSSWCCVNFFSYGSCSVSPSTLYTYGIVYKNDTGYTGSNYMYRYEYNGGTYVTESGVHSTSNRIHLGDGWWWAWGTFTTQPTTNTLNGLASFYYQYSTSYDKMSVAKVFLAAGNYSSLHPKYWPDVNTTRSSTTALRDLTGNNTLTINSLTYGTDGAMSFNGSSNSLTLPFNSSLFNFNSEQTIIIAMKNQSPSSARRNPYNQAYAGAGTITHENDTSFNYYYGINGTDGATYTSHNSPFSVTVGETAIIAITRNVSQTAWYKNGVLGNTQSNPYGSTVVTGTNSITLGSGYAGSFGGNIYSVMLYNRALTANEILQNFNSVKGIYGL